MEPTLDPVDFSCLACGHRWTGKLLNNVPVKAWVAYVRSLRCPDCCAGSKKIAIQTKEGPE